VVRLPVGRRLGEAVDATVGRVGGVARGLTQDTVQQIVDDLTPHLIEETLPEIIEAILPRIVEELTPKIIDGLTPHLIERTVPAVLEGTTPALADELLPALLDRLRPFLDQQYAPALIDAVTPHVLERTAPQVVEGLLPMIRAEVMPAILEDVAADPRIRDLVRQQSLGLLLDAQEGFRRRLARADDALDRAAARIRPGGRQPAAGRGPAAMPGRSTPYAGAVTRTVGLGVDLGLLALLGSVGLAAAVALLNAVTGSAPDWAVAALSALFAAAGPVYFALCWWTTGTTLGSLLAGYTVRTPEDRRLGFLQSVLRAWLGLVLLPVWVAGVALSPLHPRRAAWHDLLTRTQARYLVSEPAVHPPAG
jgi:hypothetical protein